MSCGRAASPTQPSVTATTTDSHFGERIQQNFVSVAMSAPAQTTESTVHLSAPCRLMRPTAV